MVYRKKLCAVLDMDGTLISSEHKRPLARPYLKSFFKYVFSTCRYVGIWTAANRAWYDEVDRKVFQPILSSLGKKFAFVYLDSNTIIDEQTGVCKPLRNIWQRRTGVFVHFRPANTFMIEDTEDACGKNRSSVILISRYKGGVDCELKMMIRCIEKLKREYQKTGDVRKIKTI